jgi:hypothetical protein
VPDDLVGATMGSESKRKKTRAGATFGMWIAIGTGVGMALGAALHNIAIGVALGSGIGVAIGAAMEQQQKKK